ncbi:MAG: hypothetical protein ACK5NN_13245 [Sphingomonadaceae bacterium]
MEYQTPGQLIEAILLALGDLLQTLIPARFVLVAFVLNRRQLNFSS